MKFKVFFTSYFRKEGIILINDNALIIKGKRRKFHVPIIDFFAGFWKQILYEDTIRTIPYLQILQYESVGYKHRLSYTLLEGEIVTVNFKGLFEKYSGENQNFNSKESRLIGSPLLEINKRIKEKLQENISIARTFEF